MKKLILLGLLVLSGQAMATKITMTDSDELDLEGGKRLRIYENSIYLFTLVIQSQTCPYTKTFYISDNEK